MLGVTDFAPRICLIIGSAPDAVRARSFDCGRVDSIVAINNGWRIRDDWTHVVYPEDFPPVKRPVAEPGQQVITAEQFVPANNASGGIIYAGATMAFTAAYWALHALQPAVMAFIGTDMVYDGSHTSTHFYGDGEADPLRDDPTLASLEAKANRLLFCALERECLCVNLSNQPRSRLTFPRLEAASLAINQSDMIEHRKRELETGFDKEQANRALDEERRRACFVESGDYWNFPDQWNAEDLALIDALWLEVFKPSN